MLLCNFGESSGTICLARKKNRTIIDIDKLVHNNDENGEDVERNKTFVQ